MTKICKKCKIRYNDHAVACLNCGGPLSKENNSTGVLIFLIIVIILIVAVHKSNLQSNFSNAIKANTKFKVQEKSEQQKKYEKFLAQFDWHNDDFGVKIDSAKSLYGVTTIRGRAMSLRDKDYSYVQINIGLYLKNGSKIGTAFDNIDNLLSGTTWQFEATGFTSYDKCVYKIEDVSGW